MPENLLSLVFIRIWWGNSRGHSVFRHLTLWVTGCLRAWHNAQKWIRIATRF